MEAPLDGGGSADIWKSEYDSKIVAAKVLRIYSTSGCEAARKVSYLLHAIPVNKLTVSNTAVLQGGHDLEVPPSPKRAAVDRCDDDGGTIRDGLKVDGKWGHYPISEEPS